MTRAAAEATTIAHLRVTAEVVDAETAHRAAAAIRLLDLQPLAIPPAAILCVRALRDPMPGGLDLRSHHAPRATRWEAAVRDALGDALRHAARPVRDVVPASADAVLFADRAELLACAARETCRRAGGWWWRPLLDGAATPSSVAREWLRTPEAIPAAAERLAARGGLAAFVSLLDTPEVLRLTGAMLLAFALPEAIAEIVDALTNAVERAGDAASNAVGAHVATLPWRTFLPNEILREPLQPAQRAFAAAAIILRRVPHLARGAAFAANVLAVARLPGPAPHGAVAPEEVRLPIAIATEIAPGKDRSEAIDAASPPLKVAPAKETEETTPQPPRREPVRRHSAALPPPSAAARAVPPTTSAPTAPSERVVDAQPSPSPIPQHAAGMPLFAVAPDLDVATEYAGVFFLINVAIALGFYSDFTSPAQRGLDLPVDDFLALTGRRFVGDAFVGDPLSRVLTDPARPRLEALDERTVVEPIVDALARALPVDDPPRFLVARPGRVTTTPIHIDVWFSLAAHPIEIRMAGLDRDPGWIPAAGRYVAFHFH